MIRENRDVLERCAQLLLEKEKIGRDEFEALFDQKEETADRDAGDTEMFEE